MGLPVTVYRSSDAGAPIINPEKPSDWIAILKACLVDGYGAKAPLGWTMEFEDAAAFKAVFKNKVADGGSGGMVQVESHNGTDGTDNRVRFTAARTISALDTYFNKVGYRTVRTFNSSFYCSGWTIVGTSRGFWVIQLPGSGGGMNTNNATNLSYCEWIEYLFVGDVDSLIPNDMGVFTLVSTGAHDGMTDSNLPTVSWKIQNGTYSFGASLYAADGSAATQGYGCSHGVSGLDADLASTDDPISLGVPILLQQACLLTEGSGLAAVNPGCRAKIPGLFRHFFNGFRGMSTPIIQTYEGFEFQLFTGYERSVWAVQCSGEWYV